MAESIDLRLLAAYLDGTATDEEKGRVVGWIGADVERRAAVAELAASWATNARDLERRYDADGAWTRFASDLHLPRSSAPPNRLIALVQPSAAIKAWAAVLLIAVTAGAWWILARNATSHRPPLPSERIYQTARAQRAVVRLSDGSEVSLNAESRLRIPADFGARRREVLLDGQAFFRVVHDTGAPFTVRTPAGTTRDIGTKFSVRAYPEDGPQLDVVVAEGAVVIAPVSGRDSLVLRASEAGRVTADGELRAEHGVDVDVLLSWTEGRLEFKNVPLRDVVPVLARWYDAEIRLGDEQLGVYPITANLTGERVGEAVDAIARVINARVVKRGSTLLLIRNLAR